MISLEDCIGLCGLDEDEVAAISEHEHIPEIAAAALANYLLLNGNLELSRRINIVRHSRRAEITTLHEVLWMRPRVPPTPPM